MDKMFIEVLIERVIPKPEYESPLWSNNCRRNIDLPENGQRRATATELSYWERTAAMDFSMLEERDRNTMFKLLNSFAIVHSVDIYLREDKRENKQDKL